VFPTRRCSNLPQVRFKGITSDLRGTDIWIITLFSDALAESVVQGLKWFPDCSGIHCSEDGAHPCHFMSPNYYFSSKMLSSLGPQNGTGTALLFHSALIGECASTFLGWKLVGMTWLLPWVSFRAEIWTLLFPGRELYIMSWHFLCVPWKTIPVGLLCQIDRHECQLGGFFAILVFYWKTPWKLLDLVSPAWLPEAAQHSKRAWLYLEIWSS
jgi:hypothetical protein